MSGLQHFPGDAPSNLTLVELTWQVLNAKGPGVFWHIKVFYI